MGAQVSRKFCPVCKFANVMHASICQHCGAPLGEDIAANLTTGRDEGLFEVTEEIKEQVTRDYSPPSEGLALFLLKGSEPIALCMEQEFILGRAKDATSETVINLTEFDGFGFGVSRRHAMIKIVEDKYVLIDLNSSNGTWLNGERLLPTKVHDLPSRGVIQLGRLKLVVIYLCPPQKKI